jgi:methionine-rich copper-binding protein CopC
MKKDVAALTATAVAVIIMVVAMVAMCTSPAAAPHPSATERTPAALKNAANGPWARALRPCVS